MAGCADGHHTAFVIMPYGAAFDDLYDDFIYDVLTSANFETTRADEVTASASIMNTIIASIERSCIIVVDLTDENPNVFYEMGIAHALHKPVIYLAQNVDGLPFDIKAYRVIHYTRDYAVMKTAREELSKVASGVLDGTTEFGNPFSDHKGEKVMPTCSADSASGSRRGDGGGSADTDGPPGSASNSGRSDGGSSADTDPPPGILDHQVAMEEGFQDVRDSIEEIGVRTGALGDNMTASTEKLNATQGDRSPNQARRQRDLVRSLAKEVDSYASFMSGANDRCNEAIKRSRPALEEMLVASEDDSNDRQELLSTLDNVEREILGARRITSKLASDIESLPNVEQSFTRAARRAVRELRRFGGNIDQLLSLLARTRQILQLKLDDQPSEG